MKGQKTRSKNDGLYCRGKVWWMNFTVNGKAYQRSTGTEDKELAVKILEKVKAEIVLGKWFDRDEKEEKHIYTFGELAVKYLDYCRARSHKKWKDSVVKILVDDFGANTLLDDFTTKKVEDFQTERLKAGTPRKGKDGSMVVKPNSPGRVNRLISVLRHMLNKATDWKMMDGEVRKEIKFEKLPEENERLRFLSREEMDLLVSCCATPVLRAIVITALNTGMRKGEILGLVWEEVDFKHGFIRIEGHRRKNKKKLEIPINSVLKETLQGIVRRIDSPYVFVNPDTGDRFHRDLKRSFQTALKKAGIHDFHFHDLRHTFASHLAMAGVPLVLIKELLGHSDIKMTVRYAHLAPGHAKNAVEILAKNKAPKGGDSYNFLTVGAEGEKLAGVAVS